MKRALSSVALAIIVGSVVSACSAPRTRVARADTLTTVGSSVGVGDTLAIAGNEVTPPAILMSTQALRPFDTEEAATMAAAAVNGAQRKCNGTVAPKAPARPASAAS